MAATGANIPSDSTGDGVGPPEPPQEPGRAPEPEWITIDELAARSGVPTRTIRFYQSKGTLPAPERRGRVAYYGPDHLRRLELIAELQDRGLRLDAIRDALSRIEAGDDSLGEWLGMGDQLQAPWSDDRPAVFTEQELLDKLDHPRPGTLAELERIGFIKREKHSRPAAYLVPSPGLLEIGLALIRAGIDPVTVAEAEELIRQRIRRLAEELVEFFSDRASTGFGARGAPDEIVRAYEALRPQGLRAVQLIFAQEMERALREFVERGGAMPPPAAARKRKGDGGSRGLRTERLVGSPHRKPTTRHGHR
ncbi:MAG: MerR family transcriptional regulator [Acidimicrobiales bacterium]|nr:MerR family transcriptional regulator [Acidimicrobiales bacterium]